MECHFYVHKTELLSRQLKLALWKNDVGSNKMTTTNVSNCKKNKGYLVKKVENPEGIIPKPTTVHRVRCDFE